jgi:phosphoglycerol transferase
MLSEKLEPFLRPSTALPGRDLTDSFLDRWPRPRRSFWHTLLYYAGAAFLSLVILTWLGGLWNADFAAPFSYGGDGVFTQMWVQGLIENGWYLHHPRLGAPGELRLESFPMADNLHFAILKLITLFVARPGSTCNLYYLLTYPLTTLSSLFVLRRLLAARAPALVCSLLFTFLPYHYMRGMGHLFLAAYYHVPLLAFLALRTYQGMSPLDATNEHGTSRSHWTWSALGAVLVCVLAGSGGVYYGFFTGFFLLVGGACASWRAGRLKPLLGSLVLVSLISLTVLANVLPTLIDRWQHGVNECAVDRSPVAAEIYGLKIAQMLLPVSGHRLSALRAFKNNYNRMGTPLVNENDSAALGFVAGLGFLLLVIGLLARSRRALGSDVADGLGVLNMSAVLLGTIGGFGSLVGFLVTPWIRAYNRVSVFIAFFALAMVALAITRLQARLAATRSRRALFYLALSGLLGLGLFDQTNRGFGQIQHEATRCSFAEDAEFVARIESRLPEGSAIFQLPYLPFPEVPPPRPMADYDPFRPYFHSRKLSWSYGAVKGTYTDAWQQAVVRLPINQMVDRLVLAGFDGVYVDRLGYEDRAEDLECGLFELVDDAPLQSSSGRFAFYDLGAYRQRLRQMCSGADWQRRQQEALMPLLITWPRGSALCEADGYMSWHWSRNDALCMVHNPTNQARTAAIEVVLEARSYRPCKLLVGGPLIEEELTISDGLMHFAWTREIPPGEHPIHLHFSEPPAVRSKDLRLVLLEQ